MSTVPLAQHPWSAAERAVGGLQGGDHREEAIERHQGRTGLRAETSNGKGYDAQSGRLRAGSTVARSAVPRTEGDRKRNTRSEHRAIGPRHPQWTPSPQARCTESCYSALAPAFPILGEAAPPRAPFPQAAYAHPLIPSLPRLSHLGRGNRFAHGTSNGPIVSGPAKPDVELVRRAQQGDRAAFAELFESLHRPVLGYVYHLVGDTPTAEDVVQDAFVRAHQRIGQLGPPYDFKSWIYRIAGNLAMDHLRGSRRIVDLDEPLPMEEPPTTRRPLERKVQREETRRSVQETLAGLPDTYRQALILRELNGLTYGEVAHALECSAENARQLVHRARLRFRELHGLKAVAAAGTPCRELGDLLSAYQDGEIPGANRRAVRAHIASCRECRETHGDLKKIAALLAALPPIIPSPGWKSSVLGRIGAPPPPPPPPPAALGGWAVAAVAAPAVALALFAGALFIRRASLPEAPLPISTLTATVPHAPASEAASVAAPALARTSTPAPTSTTSPTRASTATLGAPFVTAVQSSNCRFGPGTVYDVIDFLDDGETSPIDGRNLLTTWWWIRRTDGAGHCWVWDDNVTVAGDLSGVPVIPDPPTPTPVDEVAPVVAVSHSPAIQGRPTDLDRITFTATASDNVHVARIEIWLQGPGVSAASLRRTCLEATTCTVTLGPLNAGQGIYFARAWDPAGNRGEAPQTALTVYIGLQ